MEEMIVIANNKKLIGVNMVWNGWERHWMTDKTGDAVFRSILKAERTYDECYVREVGKKVKSRAMNLPLDWEVRSCEERSDELRTRYLCSQSCFAASFSLDGQSAFTPAQF